MDPLRRTGRTQRMLDELCDAVAAGQPRSRVFGHTRRYAHGDLRLRTIAGLVKRGLTIGRITNCSIFVEGSVILFYAGLPEDNNLRGTHGYGDFVDHHTLEVHARQSAQEI